MLSFETSLPATELCTSCIMMMQWLRELTAFIFVAAVAHTAMANWVTPRTAAAIFPAHVMTPQTTGIDGGPSDQPRPAGLNRVEGVAPRLIQNTDQGDHEIGAL